MGSKHRYNTHAQNKGKRKSHSDIIPRQIEALDKLVKGSTECDTLDQSLVQEQDTTETDSRTTEQQLIKFFNENRDRKVFDPISKTVDFSGRRPTDYKLNKHVILPKPIDSLGEFECELRRREYMGVFNKVKQQEENKDRAMRKKSIHNRNFFHKRKKRKKVENKNKAAIGTIDVSKDKQENLRDCLNIEKKEGYNKDCTVKKKNNPQLLVMKKVQEISGLCSLFKIFKMKGFYLLVFAQLLRLHCISVLYNAVSHIKVLKVFVF